VVITMSIMPPFTYPNLSPYSHRVITVIWDLQIFPCPMSEDATCPSCHLIRLVDLQPGPFTIFQPLVQGWPLTRHLRRLETSGVTSRFRLGFTWLTWSCRKGKGGRNLHFRVKVRQDMHSRVDFDLGIFMAFSPHPQQFYYMVKQL
jgi:hypothetical protein